MSRLLVLLSLLLSSLQLSMVVVGAQDQEPSVPQLNGRHFKITALQENGFLDMTDNDDGSVHFSGYLIDMIGALSKPNRANFTYTLLPPSGYGSMCNPRLVDVVDKNNNTSMTSTEQQQKKEFDPSYRTQYNCGASNVNDGPNTSYATDIYLGLYYVTPARQLVNQFTIPYLPPYSGTLAMFGTATGIDNFTALVQQQQAGILSPNATCGPAGTALLESVIQSFPGLYIRGILGGEQDIYEAFVNRSCQVYITDGPIAAQFVLRRSRRDECVDVTGAPIGVIGDPMQFGLSHYAIGIRQDIDPFVTHTLSYWMSILMTCNPLDPQGLCPEGNFASFYAGRGGTGGECGYLLYPTTSGLGAGVIVGVVVAAVALVMSVYTLWHKYRLKRQKRHFAKKSKAAMAQADREREFNEYMAHEVRNPLATAIAALSFVSSKSSDPAVVPDPEHRALIKNDVNVIDGSLSFVNELLRNLLDLHRTQAGHEIKLNLVPTDVMHDIFEPVATILFMRGAAVKIETICNPNNLTIMADRMRLKQICLNLAANSSKFVQEGFIRLRAEVIPVVESSPPIQSSFSTQQTDNGNGNTGGGDIEEQLKRSGRSNNKHATGNVVLYVEDSGPGIPEQKRRELFCKFQESLDVLHQGTGIGLSVCKNLSGLMGAVLSLDDDFDSGISGCPGACFKLEMHQAPLEMDHNGSITMGSDDGEYNVSAALQAKEEDLPENLNILFVDDDMMLRKMFSRVLKMTAPTWTIKEASNGETSLKIVDNESFDIIFVDQYMASVEKQLLGTETVRAMRAKGVESIICGLSANDVQDQFSDAGANAFMVKPFPCKKDALKAELWQMLAPPQPSNGRDSVIH